ncbi:MAG: hypothetical protein INR62_11770 [Rhodospirillales bacterium]|nr:hypothetical protein [Acetobacter sp.]
MAEQLVQSRVDAAEPTRVPLVLAILHAVFFLGSLVVVPVLAPSASIPNPFGPDEPSRRFFLENASTIRLSDWLQLASAVCLAALACAWPRSLQGSGTSHKAGHLTLAGGLGAAVLLALAAGTSWSLASPGSADPGPAFRVLQFLPFLLGGPGWAAFFALFMVGAAQSSAGRIPRWMLWSGYGLVLTSGLATLVLLTLAAAPLLPVTRFLGFLWLIAAALLSQQHEKVLARV